MDLNSRQKRLSRFHELKKLKKDQAMKLHLLEHEPLDFSDTNIDRWAAEKGHTITRTYVCSGEPLPDPDALDWLMLMGGSPQAYDEASNPWLLKEKPFVAEIIERRIPIIGICFGAQLLAQALGGELFPAEHGEIGWHKVKLTPEGRQSPLLRDLPEVFKTFHWHWDHFSLPPGCVRLASSLATSNQMFASLNQPAVGIQFHPEYTLELIDFFAREHSQEWVPDTFICSKDTVLAQKQTMEDT